MVKETANVAKRDSTGEHQPEQADEKIIELYLTVAEYAHVSERERRENDGESVGDVEEEAPFGFVEPIPEEDTERY